MSTSPTSTLNSNQVNIYPKLFEFYMDDTNSHRQYATLFNQFEFAVKYKVLSTAPKKYVVDEPEGFIQPKSSIDLMIKHQSSAFLSENVTDKLRIQIYQASNSSNTNLMLKKDLPLYSIVNRKDHIFSQMLQNSKIQSSINSANHLNESFNEDQLKYSLSSFSYGNSLNDMMALNTNESTRNTNKLNKDSNKKQPATMNNKHKFYMNNPQYNPDNVNYLVILIGLVCLTILFLPLSSPITTTTTTTSSESSSYLPSYLHISYEIKLFCSFVLGMVTMVILKN